MLPQRTPNLFSFEVNFSVLLIDQKILDHFYITTPKWRDRRKASFTLQKAQKTTSTVMRLLVQWCFILLPLDLFLSNSNFWNICNFKKVYFRARRQTFSKSFAFFKYLSTKSSLFKYAWLQHLTRLHFIKFSQFLYNSIHIDRFESIWQTSAHPLDEISVKSLS